MLQESLGGRKVRHFVFSGQNAERTEARMAIFLLGGKFSPLARTDRDRV